MEALIKADGWIEKNARGSHHQYIHPNKLGKVTIPEHKGDLKKKVINTILKQAGLK
jgi:predicted RNA binding protein YcfA (HicA-like mRNA interferase family)